MDDADEHAKRFDNFMYGLMLAHREGTTHFKRGKKQLLHVTKMLLERTTIPQIKNKLVFINIIGEESFWNDANLLSFEQVRVELRGLMNLLVDKNSTAPIYTNLKDTILSWHEGKEMYEAYAFEDYKLKVNRYIEQNRDTLAIHKLRNNIPLSALDYESLERIFTGELGSADDYKREYQDTPFGLLVRKIAKLEVEAANDAFSEFINDHSLNQMQIVFVKKIVDYIVQNGYIDDVAELVKPPFDKPQSFVKLFDGTKQKRLVEVVNQVKENATKILS
ncbi:type I restriction-modification enzyme R subunit C-terminal domain-containing protein [Paenibacillus assamensis]|uniref:type I restriction-modification enzyme R subunit C-terminal domain-containing protein n=1 Tax=Paenibacillus assamensis TaxID=311244 RepID=UPI00041B57BD|nr:type I restriction-modification enzyme R subunit C-terminal domain-containing protein [Paenibacillus assamensis]